MKVRNEAYLELKMKWNTITFPLKAGTPISLGGVVANNERAVGIIPETIKERPLIDTTRIIIAGYVDKKEVESEFGQELNEKAIESMSGIKFFGEDLTPDPEPISLPLMANIEELKDTAELADVIAKVNELITALIESGIMAGE